MVTVKIKKEYFSIILILLFAFLLFRFPDEMENGIANGLIICFQTIFPSLFPFLVLSAYVTKSHVLAPIYKIAAPVSKVIFRQPACTVSVIILSLLGGFPVGIKMANDLFIRGEITHNQAKRLCFFCMNAGPAFTITAVGGNMLKSPLAGLIIYISLCVSSVFLGILSRFLGNKNDNNVMKKPLADLSCLSASITSGINSILGICGWIVLFNGLIECFNVFNNNYFLRIFVKSTVEVTTACNEFAGEIPLPYFSFIIGFGGFCVHCQILDCLKNCKVKYSHFLFSRVLNGCISAIITHVILIFIPVEIDVFANSGEISPAPFSVSVWGFLALIIMCVIMIFDIDRKKKIC